MNKTDTCWNWKGGKNSDGYGYFDFENSSGKAHRASWIINFGSISSGLSVLHHCDNPACVRPDHLFLGTQKDNMEDCARKGRIKAGKRAVKLNPEKVRKIRLKIKNGESVPAVASEYGVNNSAIHFIIKGVNWKHVQ